MHSNKETLYVYTERKTYTLECGLDLTQWINFILEIYNDCGDVESYEYCMADGKWIARQDIDEKVRYFTDLCPEFAEVFNIKYC